MIIAEKNQAAALLYSVCDTQIDTAPNYCSIILKLYEVTLFFFIKKNVQNSWLRSKENNGSRIFENKCLTEKQTGLKKNILVMFSLLINRE